MGVFDSEDTSSDATAPELTLGTITGTFTRGEQITGSSSGATARIIDTTSPMSYVLEMVLVQQTLQLLIQSLEHLLVQLQL